MVFDRILDENGLTVRHSKGARVNGESGLLSAIAADYKFSLRANDEYSVVNLNTVL